MMTVLPVLECATPIPTFEPVVRANISCYVNLQEKKNTRPLSGYPRPMSFLF